VRPVLKWLLLVTLLVAAGAFLAACADQGQSAVPKVGQPAPDISLPRLDGGTVRLADLRGKVVMLNFWATYCPSCKDELPAMAAVYKQVSDKGGVILAVDQSEDTDTVRKFAEDNGLTFPIALDAQGGAGGVYAVRYIPTTYFVDKNGIIRYSKVGPMDQDTISSYFASLLN